MIFTSLFFFGCAKEELSDKQHITESLKASEKAWLLEGGVVGEECATGCIWSAYAISRGVQSATHDCIEQPCTCVEDGNIYGNCRSDLNADLNDSPRGWEEQSESKPPRTNEEQVHAGAQCAVGCIWSPYAVSIGAQDSEAVCDGIPCACVADGDVYHRCNTPSDESTAPPEAPRTQEPAPSPDPAPHAEQPRNQVPYFYQYANRINGPYTCQNTSIAMVLSYYGWRGVPDEITAEFGRHRAQDPVGLASVFNTLARRAGIGERMRASTEGSLAELKTKLDTGYPVIVHAYTTAGHVVVVTGYDTGGYYVNDPAGRWNEVFRGGYPGGYDSNIGRGVYYQKAAFEAAISTSDGYSYLPLWIHEIN